MDIAFLAAAKPIVKRYELNEQGDLIKHSYPHVANFTSHTHSTTLAQFAGLLSSHAAKGRCLLKGKLNRELADESRAGSTDPDEHTDWICLDLDGVEGFADLNAFLTSINCDAIDYVVQWSSSMGLQGHTGLRAHVFMELDKAHHPKLLKQWLTGLNLNTPVLRSQTELTKTGNSLYWPLDITTCQNDKLLYIATPKFGRGIKDPFAKKARIEFVKRNKRTLSIPYPVPSREALIELTDARVNELRVAANLPKRRRSSFKYDGPIEYMCKPNTAQITGIKTERGFTYLNLNGGDSWGYYHHEDDATFIFNFKGEPTYKTEELLPDYWAKPSTPRASQLANTPTAQGTVYLALRDFKTSQYYNGFFDQSTNKLTLSRATSETQLRHFLKQYNQNLGEFVPDWDLIWDPKNPVIVDLPNQKINTYEPSTYIQNAKPSAKATLPPLIKRIVEHALGNDPTTIDYFWNWLASIVQSLDMTTTAWIFQGVQGTGKGLIYHKVLSPLFGKQNTVLKGIAGMESEFNGFLENKFLVFIDEIEKMDGVFQSRLNATLRTLITEPDLSVRKMHQMPYMAKNYINVIMSSNQTTPVDIPPDDRRYNVGLFQTEKLAITQAEVDTVENELQRLANYLMSVVVDRSKLRTPVLNSARATLISTNRTAIDTAIDALSSGDLEFFWDHLPSSKNSPLDNMSALKLMPFRNLLVNLVTTQDPVLTRDELHILLDWTVGNMPHSPNKFTSLLKHHRVHLVQVWKNKRNVRGIRVNWRPNQAWLQGALQEIQEKAV